MGRVDQPSSSLVLARAVWFSALVIAPGSVPISVDLRGLLAQNWSSLAWLAFASVAARHYLRTVILLLSILRAGVRFGCASWTLIQKKISSFGDEVGNVKQTGVVLYAVGPAPSKRLTKMSYALHRRSTLRQSRSDCAEGRAGSTLASTQAKRFEEMIRKLE